VLGLLASLLNAITFLSVLWTVGGDLIVHASGLSLTVPAYLVIAVGAYSAVLSATMLLVGRQLTPVIEEKNEAEAALRSAACHLREVGERTAMENDALQQRHHLRSIVERVIGRWHDLCKQLIRTTSVGHVNFLFAPVFAWILCAPKYLGGDMSLGDMAQVAAAFIVVQGALNWFVDNYPRLADWLSSVNRVSSLLLALDQIQMEATPVISTNFETHGLQETAVIQCEASLQRCHRNAPLKLRRVKVRTDHGRSFSPNAIGRLAGTPTIIAS
jgi:putative ATP-binding cassette transporter